jgi:quaternary ammonium compound-resistance protein SugE
MAWLYLLLAALCEASWVVGIKWATKHPRWWPILLIWLISIVSFLLLSRALRDLPLSICYVTWIGIAVIGAWLGGILFYGERFDPQALLWLLLVIIGIVGLKRSLNDSRTKDDVITSPAAAAPTALPDDK